MDKLTAEQILKRARKAAQSASSVHVKAASQDASLDMELTQGASDGNRSAGDASIQTRVVGDTLYVKADDAYWQQAFPSKKVANVNGRWVSADLKNPKLKSWRQTTVLAPMMKTFLSTQGASSTGAVGVQQGQPAVPVTSGLGTVWVATTGKPYVLLITSAPESGPASTAEFTDWDKKVSIKAPPKKDTIDITDLT